MRAAECTTERCESARVTGRGSGRHGRRGPSERRVRGDVEPQLLGDRLELAVVIATLTAGVFDATLPGHGVSRLMQQKAEHIQGGPGEAIRGDEHLRTDLVRVAGELQRFPHQQAGVPTTSLRNPTLSVSRRWA